MKMLKILKQQLIGVLLCSLLQTSLAYADDIAVIVGVNTDISQLSAKQIQRIFLRKERVSNQGHRWIPVNLRAQQRLRTIFSDQLLQKDRYALERYWNEQYFNGISPPYVLASEEAVLRFVSKTPYALGYVLSCHLDERVRVVYRLHIDSHESNCP